MGQLRVKRLEVKDFKRVNVVVLECDEHWNVIGGRNSQGKSSVLDAVEGAMRGKRSMPVKAIRDGAERAEIVADLGAIVVRRITTEKTDRLVVTNAEGYERKRPQELLDALWGATAIDPLEFQRLTPKAQAERMLELLGLDFSALDRERFQLYQERTLINRQHKDAAAVASVKVKQKTWGVTFDEAEVRKLMDSLQEAERHNSEQERLATALVHENSMLTGYKTAIQHCETECQNIRDQIAALQRKLADTEQRIETGRRDMAEVEKRRQQLNEKRLAFEPVDTDAIRALLEEARGRERAVAINADADAAAEAAKVYEKKAAELTERIETIDAKKSAMVSAAEFPVDGLTFGSEGLEYNGQPFAQASSAEKWKVSIAVGIAQKPQFAVLLIRDGEKLDADSREIVRRMAVENGCQIFVEDCRATDDEATVVIEDGMVK